VLEEGPHGFGTLASSGSAAIGGLGGSVSPNIETAMSGDVARASERQQPTGAQHGQEATARLFRSIRAGRSWLRAQGSATADRQVAACVRMRRGNDEPPVFMIPGAPGSILQLGPLAAALTAPMPVYAIKPRGIEDGEIPCQRIEEMAEYSIDLIMAVRPRGPYLLAGYSAGGLVALEMARQLSAAGHEVPIVVLLDTYPSRKIWPLRCHIEILARQTVRAVWALRQCTPMRAVRHVIDRIRNLSEYLAASGVKFIPARQIVPLGASAASRRVYLATFNAGEAYRPPRYSGKVVFVQPEEVPNLEPWAPAQVWQKFLTDLEVRKVPGSHLGMLESGATAIAAEISDCLIVPTASAERVLAT
jgi:acetoacetyl-CoA synthetase